MELTAPERGALIVRCEVTGESGERLNRLDVPLAVKGDEAPMQALLALPVRLSRAQGSVTNDGDMAALAVGCSLLPGESAPEGEWVNEGEAGPAVNLTDNLMGNLMDNPENPTGNLFENLIL